MYAPDGRHVGEPHDPWAPRLFRRRRRFGYAGELAAAAAGYFGHAGKFEVDEAAGVVIHRIEVALTPNLAGTDGAPVYLSGWHSPDAAGDPTPAGTTPYIIWDRLS